MSDKTSGNSRRGFASMTPEKRRAIASKGGKAVAPANRSFSRDKDLARKAGAKGGLATPAGKRAYARDLELARMSGAKGGSAPSKASRDKS